MGAKPTQIFFKVRLPAALPNLFAGLKVGSSLAVIGAILGEYIAAERGLGYLQLQANANMDTSLNMAAIVVISLLGTVLYGALALIESAVSFVKVQK
jgi:NitT/TauT family transport system permease protein